jgi:hypothetical protein
MAKQKNPAAVELGRFGGRKGGKARDEKLTEMQRIEITRKAARARWAKWRQKPQQEEESS